MIDEVKGGLDESRDCLGGGEVAHSVARICEDVMQPILYSRVLPKSRLYSFSKVSKLSGVEATAVEGHLVVEVRRDELTKCLRVHSVDVPVKAVQEWPQARLNGCSKAGAGSSRHHNIPRA